MRYEITTTNYCCPTCGKKLKSSNDVWTEIAALLCMVLIIFLLPFALAWGLVECILKIETPYACDEYKYKTCPKCGTKVRMTDIRKRCYDELNELEQWQFVHRGLKGLAIALGGSTMLGFGFSFLLIDPNEVCQTLGTIFLCLCLISFFLFIVIVVYWKKQYGELERSYQAKHRTQTATNAQKVVEEQRTAKVTQREQAAEEERKKTIERARWLRQFEEGKKLTEEEAKKKKAAQDTATCKELLERCGMQFFIKYYPQIVRSPIRDIKVSDHYLPEREVRLTAAKKIVDLGLTKCALHYIIETYGDILSSEIIERAQSLLNEIEGNENELSKNTQGEIVENPKEAIGDNKGKKGTKTLKEGELIYAKTNAELLNTLLGTHYRSWMKSYILLDEDEMLWMTRLDGVVRAGWKDTMLNGQIIEEYIGGHPYPSNIDLAFEVRRRAVFEKSDWGGYFIFRGVFELDRSSTLTHRVLKKVFDEINL